MSVENSARRCAAVVVAGAAAFRGEVELVPPFELGFRWQWHPVRLLAPDEITTHGDQRLATLRPKRRDDVRSARSPIATRYGRLLDLEGVHQRDDIYRDDRLLSVARRFLRKEARRAVAAQI